MATSDTWVEHYRPKSVYYWLAYEWSNLIPTCTKCNRKKRVQFPLIDVSKKVTDPPLSRNKLDKNKCKANGIELLNETPYVIHPEIDNPHEFLDFKLAKNKLGVEILGKDKQGRGKKTAEICDLNRLDLKLDRQEKVIDNLLELFDFLFYQRVNEDLDNNGFFDLFSFIYQKLVSNSENIKLEHTLLRKVILNPEKFEEIVIPNISNKEQQKIVLFAFKKCSNQ